MFRNLSRACALALGLLGAAVLSGTANAAPNDAQLASKIDTFLTGKSSPLAGLGSVFVKNGIASNVDPRLLVAIAGQESSYATNWVNCPASGKNAWSLFLNDKPCSNTSFATYEEGIQKIARQMVKNRELHQKFGSIEAIGSRYCPLPDTGCEHWAPGVTAIYVQLGGDPADLSYKSTAIKIDFEEMTGPSVFGSADPEFAIGVVKFKGGQVLNAATNLPADRSKLYGTAYFCTGCLPQLTLTFIQPVSNVRFFLYNGLTTSVTYTAVSSKGETETATLLPNSSGGNTTIFFDDMQSILSVTISGGSSPSVWDFFIDNLEYTID